MIWSLNKKKVYPRHLFLNISTQCNMDCPACYNHLFTKGSNIMNLETAQKATKVFYENRDINYDRHYIMFFGGEPLMNFSLIEEYLAWFKKHYYTFKCDFHVFTNGLLLDKYRVDFFLENNISIFLSYDFNLSCYNIHKSASKNSYEKLKCIISYAIKKRPELIIPYYIINDKQIIDLEYYLEDVYKMGAKKAALTRKFFTKWDHTEIKQVQQITKSFKEKHNIAILVFPDIESNCDNCITNNIMVYPNGDIYDLCVVSAGTLIKLKLAKQNIINHYYFGSVFSCKSLKINIEKKRQSLNIKSNSKICTYCPTLNNSEFVKYLSKS